MTQFDVNQSFMLSLEMILPKYMEKFSIDLIDDFTIQVTESYGFEVLFITSERFPAVAPTILVTSGGQTEQLQPVWDLETHNVTERMDSMLSQFLVPPGPYKKAFGTNGMILSQDNFYGKETNWKAIYTGKNPEREMADIRRQLFARTRDLLSKDLKDKIVLVIGAGSVGSYIVEQLVRNGVEIFVLIDPDTVEIANLSRTNYSLHDIGTSKVSALARNMMNINPAIKIDAYDRRIEEFQNHEFSQLIEQADLVIAATDDMDTQLHINRFAYAKDKASLFVGLYKGAKGGEVIMTIPEITPCYRCSAPVRANVGGDTDYETGMLKGEVALNADIHHVASSAVKMGLALLSCNSKDLDIRNFLLDLLQKRFSYLTMSMEDKYWFYPKIFKETGGQYAYQSVWLSPEFSPECPICGDQDHRLCPEDIPLANPETSSL
jgi:molybdopterin/thiamine biosynthesis adenylyltransferase